MKLFKEEIQSIYIEDIDEINIMLQELVKEGIIEDKTSHYIPTEKSFNIIKHELNTKGIESIKNYSSLNCEIKYDLITFKHIKGIENEYDSLSEYLTSNKIATNDLVFIKEIENSNLYRLAYNSFEVILYYKYFIKEDHLMNIFRSSGILYKDDDFGKYVDAYTNYLIFMKCKARLAEIGEPEKLDKVINELEIEDINLKHQIAFMYKLGIIDFLREKHFKHDVDDIRIKNVVAQFLNKTEKNDLESLRTYFRDNKNKKQKFWNEPTKTQMNVYKAKFKLTYSDE